MITMCLKRNDKRTDALKKMREALHTEVGNPGKKKKKAKIYKDLHTSSILHYHICVYPHINTL